MAFDQDHLLTLIDRIYEASLEPETWPALLKDVPREDDDLSLSRLRAVWRGDEASDYAVISLA